MRMHSTPRKKKDTETEKETKKWRERGGGGGGGERERIRIVSEREGARCIDGGGRKSRNINVLLRV